MTPKEKAQELIELFTFSCTACDYKFNAQRSALRAVDEIINNFGLFSEGNQHYSSASTIQYYEQVKAEIEKL